MNNPQVLYTRFQAALQEHCDVCATKPDRWHRPDVGEFTELRRLLLPPAHSGDMHCQYAMATISWLGLCSESEAQFLADRASAMKEATGWWTAAARQGFWPALDNLITEGVGLEAQRANDAFDKLQRERPDLIGTSQ